MSEATKETVPSFLLHIYEMLDAAQGVIEDPPAREKVLAAMQWLRELGPQSSGDRALIDAIGWDDDCEVDAVPALSPAEGGTWVNAWVWSPDTAGDDAEEEDDLEEPGEEDEEDEALPSREAMIEALRQDFDDWPDDAKHEYARDCFNAELESECLEDIASRYRSTLM